MNRAETARVLGKCSAYDNREVGEAMVLAWHEVLSFVDYDDALTAVARHYAVSRDWLMPVDVIEHVTDIREERAAAERAERAEMMRRQTAEICGPPGEPARTSDRSAELLAQLRRTLPPGRPEKLRGPAWRAKNPGLRDGGQSEVDGA